MDNVPLILAAVILLVSIPMGIELLWGSRQLRFLADTPPIRDYRLPQVSVVIPARDESRHIRTALGSVLAQDYPVLEIIAVNDRSRDATGTILKELAARDPRLKVLEIEALPQGWLGKTHALETGARQARGSILLFIDADVILEPSALSRGVAHLQRHNRDHIAVAPDVLMPTLWLTLVAATFGFNFSLLFRPWRAADPNSDRYVGIGAFNMMRTAAFWAAGGMTPIAMRPDDDVMLGKLLKRSGARQECLLGRELVSVEWYASTRELVRGLSKNSFAALDYSLARVALASAAQLLLYVWPFVAVLLSEGLARWLYLIIVIWLLGLFVDGARQMTRFRPWFGIGLPATTLLLMFILWRSTLLALKNGGIEWRGRRYPLDELRRNRL